MADEIFNSDLIRYSNQTTEVRNDAYVNRWKEMEEEAAKTEDRSSLSFTDMLSLMVAQFQNQTIDNQASTSDMMNQLVQMTSMQAMTSMTTQLEELTLANVMSYSASLVGQTVTIGVYDEEGKLTDFEGVVEGAGTYNGNQVIFVDGKSYLLSSIMAVGKLPPREEEGTDPVDPTDPEDPTDPSDPEDPVEPGDGAGGEEDSGTQA